MTIEEFEGFASNVMLVNAGARTARLLLGAGASPSAAVHPGLRPRQTSRKNSGSVRIAQLRNSLICYLGLAKSHAARDDSISPPAAAPPKPIPAEEDRNGRSR